MSATEIEVADSMKVLTDFAHHGILVLSARRFVFPTPKNDFIIIYSLKARGCQVLGLFVICYTIVIMFCVDMRRHFLYTCFCQEDEGDTRGSTWN